MCLCLYRLLEGTGQPIEVAEVKSNIAGLEWSILGAPRAKAPRIYIRIPRTTSFPPDSRVDIVARGDGLSEPLTVSVPIHVASVAGDQVER